MTKQEELKALLFEQCHVLLDERIAKAKGEIQSYSEQSGEETKSSAGDKYETARAMLHLEKEKIAMQLDEALKLKRALSQLENNSANGLKARLVETDKGNFFISVGLGQLSINEKKFFAISPAAPIGKLLIDAKEGDQIKFGPNTYEILSVD